MAEKLQKFARIPPKIAVIHKVKMMSYAEFTFFSPIPRFYPKLHPAVGFASEIRVNYGRNQPRRIWLAFLDFFKRSKK